MHLFERALLVSKEDIELELRGFNDISWLDFWLNPSVILFNIFQLKHSDKMTQKVGYNKVAAGIK